MKKNFKVYFIAWCIVLALFNVIAFVVPSISQPEKFTPSFWGGYVLIAVTLIGQLVCAYIAFKEENFQKLFYNMSLIQTSYIGLIVSFGVGGLCMMVLALPYWVGVVLCAIVLAINVIAILKATVPIDEAARIDEKIKTQTFFIKSLTVDAESLIARAKSETIKSECKKAYEAIRYSDPMSHAELGIIESEITRQFAVLVDAVKANDAEKVAEEVSEFCLLVAERNRKCKLLK